MTDTNSTFAATGEHLYTRLSPRPAQLPFALRSVGRIELPPGGCTPNRRISFVHLIWTIHGTGQACIDGREYEIPPQHTAAFMPGCRHCLRAKDEPWQYRWITLDGPEAELMVSGFGIDATPLPSGPCPDSLFDELEQAVLAIAPEDQARATIPVYRLLVEAACARRQDSSLPRRSEWSESIQRLLAESLDDPEIGITQIAEIAGLDRSTLTARFKQATGVGPKSYLTALRLQRAMALLRTTDLSVADVAEQCGFSCANYFIKAFAKRVGTTPNRYRRQAV